MGQNGTNFLQKEFNGHIVARSTLNILQFPHPLLEHSEQWINAYTLWIKFCHAQFQ